MRDMSGSSLVVLLCRGEVVATPACSFGCVWSLSVRGGGEEGEGRGRRNGVVVHV